MPILRDIAPVQAAKRGMEHSLGLTPGTTRLLRDLVDLALPYTGPAGTAASVLDVPEPSSAPAPAPSLAEQTLRASNPLYGAWQTLRQNPELAMLVGPLLLGKAATAGQTLRRRARRIRRYIRPAEVQRGRAMGGEQIQSVGSELIKGRLVERGDLPPTLYHVTTNDPAVRSSGVLRSFHAQDPDVPGLGKGSSRAHQGISFTTNPRTAQLIRTELVRAGAAARLDEPFDAFIRRVAREDEQLHGLTAGTLDETAAMAASEFQRLNQESARFSKDMAQSARSNAIDALRRYYSQRDRVAGIENPIIYGQPEQLARIRAENTQILQMPTRHLPGNVVIRQNPIGTHLDEVMVHSDVRLRQPRRLKDLRGSP